MATDRAPSEEELIFARLAAPFGKVKERPGKGGRVFKYIEAEMAEIRLDDVIGPGNWWERYDVFGETVQCTLGIYLPSGKQLTRVGASGFDVRKEGEQRDRLRSNVVKTAYSEALKKAAEKYGIGRYLKAGRFPNYYYRVMEWSKKNSPNGPAAESSDQASEDAGDGRQTRSEPAAPPRPEEFPSRQFGAPGVVLYKEFNRPPYGKQWIEAMAEFGREQDPPYPELIKDWSGPQCIAWRKHVRAMKRQDARPGAGVPQHAYSPGDEFDEFQ